MANGLEAHGATVVAATATITSTPQGAFIQAVYTKRQMRFYAMNESDLENISMFSTITTSAFSVAGGAIGWILNIWWEVATTPRQGGVASSAESLGDPIVKVLWGLVALCVVVAVVAQWKKRNRLQEIREQSQVITQ